MEFKLNPTQKTVTFLGLLAIGAIISNFKLALLIHFAIILIFAFALFWTLKKITGKEKNINNTIISALIISLLLHYSGPGNSAIIYSLLATFITISSKFFLEPKGMPIINPVALGLLATYGISNISGMQAMLISWWGTNYQFHFPLALLLLAMWIIFWFKNWQKWGVLMSFLVANAILNFAFNQDLEFLKFIYTDGTIYFFSAIMLIDPKSSPILKNQQIIFGILAALAYNTLSYFGVPQYALWAIAIANIGFYLMRILKKRQIDKANI